MSDSVRLLHLHTYFIFPFSIDKHTVLQNHPRIWSDPPHWIDGLDRWIAAPPHSSRIAEKLGPWRRSAYTRFDMDSPAYQDMAFFHPFVRRVFFDTGDGSTQSEALLRCYTIPIDGGKRLWFQAQDLKGRCARVEVTDIRLFMFANG